MTEPGANNVTEPSEEQISEQTATAPEPSELEVAQVRIADLERELEESKAERLRVQADSQNMLRRVRQINDEAMKFASQSLIEELLPVLDNFQRSLQSLEKGASPERIIEGITSVEKMIRKALEQAGVEQIQSVGAAFDPEIHEAIATEPSAEVAADTVLLELEPGYKLNGRLIRAAKVKVSTAPEAAE